MPEDVVDLILESSRQHLVGLVEDEHLDVVGAEDLTRDHVEDAAGRSWKPDEVLKRGSGELKDS